MEETFRTIKDCAEAIQVKWRNKEKRNTKRIEDSFTHAQQMTLDVQQRKTLNAKLQWAISFSSHQYIKGKRVYFNYDCCNGDCSLNPPLTDDTPYIEIDNFLYNVFAVFQDIVQYTGDGRVRSTFSSYSLISLQNDATKNGKGVTELCKLMTTNDVRYSRNIYSVDWSIQDPIDKLWNVIVWSNQMDLETVTVSWRERLLSLWDNQSSGIPQLVRRLHHLPQKRHFRWRSRWSSPGWDAEFEAQNLFHAHSNNSI